LLILHPPLEEAQEVNTAATAITRARIKIDFLIVKRYLVLKVDCLVNEEMGPGNSEEGIRMRNKEAISKDRVR